MDEFTVYITTNRILKLMTESVDFHHLEDIAGSVRKFAVTISVAVSSYEVPANRDEVLSRARDVGGRRVLYYNSSSDSKV